MPSKENVPIGLPQDEFNTFPKGNNYLFLIAINDYKNGIKPLHNTVNDLQKLKDCLIQHYQFEEQHLKILTDQEATTAAIDQAFDEYHDILTEEDNFLFFFSGHGHYDERTKIGYWLTANSKRGSKQSYLSNHVVMAHIRQLKARHIVGIVDSCFSEALFSDKGNSTPIDRRYNLPSRWLLTSGRLEVVSDGSLGGHSPFAKALLSQLNFPNESVIWMSELCSKVTKAVIHSSDQTPRGETLKIPGHQGGDFPFIRNGYTLDNRPEQTTAAEKFLRRFKVALRPPLSSFMDHQNRLWVYNYHQAQVFSLDKKDAVSRITFLKQEWKNFFPYPQKDKLVASDWEGNLFMINAQQKEASTLLSAFTPQSLPVHLFASIDQDRFVTATWDGKITLFEKGEEPKAFLSKQIGQIFHLPIKIVVVKAPDDNSAVSFLIVDQAHHIHWIDRDGNTKDTWKLNQAIVDLWAYHQNQQCQIIALTTEQVVLLQENQDQRIKEAITLSSSVASYAHRAVDQRSVIACSNGVISWLTWNPFGIVEEDNIKLSTGIRQIEAVYDPERPGSLLALGLTTEGNLFTTQDREIKITETTGNQFIVLDNDRRFIVQLGKEAVRLTRMPIISNRIFSVDCSLPNDTFSKTDYQNATILVKNTSRYPIPYLKATLVDNDTIDSAGALTADYEHLEIDHSAELVFSLKGTASGAIPLRIKVEIYDDDKVIPANTQTVTLQILVA